MTPEHRPNWSTAALGDLCFSAVDGPFGSNLKSEHYVTEPGVRVVRLQNIEQGRFDDNDKAWVSESYAQTLGQHEVRYGDLLVASLGDERHPFARACLYPNRSPGIVKADCFRLRLDPRCAVPGYMMRTLNSESLRSGLNGLAQGVTRDRVNLGNLLRFRVPVPPLSEQRCISEVLDTLDEAILKSEQLIAKLKQMKQGLLHDLLTRGIDENGELRDPNQQPKQFKKSPLGRIPTEWQIKSIGEVGETKLGRQRAPRFDRGANPRPYLRVVNIFDGRLDLRDVKHMDFDASEFRRYRLIPGDVLLTEGDLVSANNVGRSAVFWGEIDDCCFQNTLIRFRPQNLASASYFHFAFCFLRSTGRFAAAAMATTVFHLSAGRLQKILIQIPREEEQGKIADILLAHEDRIDATIRGLGKLRLLKHGLMDDLLTGRVRVTPLLAEPAP